MGDPYMGEIRIVSFNFPPKGWAFCNGQLLPINQNQALFSLLGTMYGGNGQTTFALPDMRSRIPVHFSQAFAVGQTGGEEHHTIGSAEMPQHQHTAQGTTSNADSPIPTGNLLGAANNAYASANAGNLTALDPTSIGLVGGSQPHENMQPYLVLNYCIALVGIYPARD
jgi:microcystin-dependent protein